MTKIKKKKKSNKRNKGRDDGGIRILDTNLKFLRLIYSRENGKTEDSYQKTRINKNKKSWKR